jgi:ADP-heptose:LPS heptosyltransferase
MDERLRMLVFEVNYLGDFVCTLPVLDGLRRTVPLAFVTAVTSPAGKELLEHSGLVDRVLAFNLEEYRTLWRRQARMLSAVRGLRTPPPNVALSVEDECSTSALLAAASGVSLRMGYDLVSRGRRLYTHRLAFDGKEGVACGRYALVRELARELGLPSSPPIGRVPVRFTASEEERWAGRHARLMSRPFVAVHPYSKLAFRSWPPERFAALASRLARGLDGWNVALLTDGRRLPGGGARRSVVEVRRTPLRELAWLLREAAVFAGNNSGPLHLALAMGTPSVSVQGPTRREWWPRGLGDAPALTVSAGLACSPCEVPGARDACPLGHAPPPCMARIPVSRVVRAVLDLADIARTAGRSSGAARAAG